MQFTKCLGRIFKLYGDTSLDAFVSYKSRHDLIDDNLVGVFEKNGFFGEQIEENDMDENYKSNRIDIFRFYMN
jgi:hypothetical protein